MYSFVTGALLATAAIASDFDYKQNGADWGTIHEGKYGLCATGLEQSPINLTTDTETSEKMEMIGYNYYDFASNGRADDPSFATSFTDEV